MDKSTPFTHPPENWKPPHAKGASSFKPNKAEIVRNAVASVINNLDERPDDGTISLLRYAAQFAVDAYECEALIERIENLEKLYIPDHNTGR